MAWVLCNIIGMKKLIFLFMGIFTFSCSAQEPDEKSTVKQSIHQFKLTDLNGETFSMSSLKGKKIMVVNTASKCGLTYQYEILEKMYKDYKSCLLYTSDAADE